MKKESKTADVAVIEAPTSNEKTSVELIITDEKNLVSEDKILSIQNSFQGKIDETAGYKKVYARIINMEMSEETVRLARELRLNLVKVRTGISRIHTAEKQFYLAAGTLVDKLKNKLTEPVSQMEEKLQEIEDFYVNQEKERLESILKLRTEMILDLDGTVIPNIEHMDDESFQILLDGLEARKAKKEKEEKELQLKNERYETRLQEISLLKSYYSFAEIDLFEINDETYLNHVKQAKEIKERKEKIDELDIVRRNELLEFWNYVPTNITRSNLGELSAESYNTIIDNCKKQKQQEEEEKERFKKETELIQSRLSEIGGAAYLVKDEIPNLAKLTEKQFQSLLAKSKKLQQIEDEKKAKLAEEKIKADALELKRQEQERLMSLKDKQRFEQWVNSISLPDINTDGMSEEYKAKVRKVQEKFTGFKNNILL